MDIKDLKRVMNRISRDSMKYIVGGAISGSVLKAFYDIFKFIYDLGRSAGSAIRRNDEKNYCSIK